MADSPNGAYPAFSPCSAIVGVGRVCYRTQFRYYENGPIGWGRYYRTTWNAPAMVHPGIFSPANNLPELRTSNGAAGELVGAVRIYDKGMDVLHLTGGPIGTDREFSGHGINPNPSNGYIAAALYPQCPRLNLPEECCLCDENEGDDGPCDDDDDGGSD